ncbi:MAG: gas vesicle protein GvpO [Pseudomonadota bacterium]
MNRDLPIAGIGAERPAACPVGESTPRAPEAAPLSLGAVIAAAEAAVSLFTRAPLDQISSCTASDSGWTVRVDVVETRARIGNNDLLASYELSLDHEGNARAFSRVGKSYREDRVMEADGT